MAVGALQDDRAAAHPFGVPESEPRPASASASAQLSRALAEVVPNAGEVLGPLRHTCKPKALTGIRAKYGVQVIKHMFDGHVVLEMLVANTAAEGTQLDTVEVRLAGLGLRWATTGASAIPSLRFNEQASAYVVLEKNKNACLDATGALTGEFHTALRFVIKDAVVDYPCENVKISTGDYMSGLTLHQGQFKTIWEQLSVRGHEATHKLMINHKTLESAVETVVATLNMEPCDKTGIVENGARGHTLLLSGNFLGGHSCLVRAVIGLDPNGSVVKLACRSTDISVPGVVARSHFASVLPSMMQPLDEVLENQMPECNKDLQVVSRDFGNDGIFEAVHNSQLSRSLMSGSFACTASTGTQVRYEGTFLNDPHSELPTPCGQGIRQNPDGSTYAGQWKDGLYDGHGEWRARVPSSESYIGDWKRGRKHGFGVQKFANGDSYEGDWANGKFQDRGKYLYANGDRFMGIWDNGMKLNGTFYFQDGRISTRRWQQGALVACQDFDPNQRSYQATITKAQVHNPMRSKFGHAVTNAVISPRGVRVDG